MEARPAVQRNNMAAEIHERMTKAAEAKEAIAMYDTKDNAARLAGEGRSEHAHSKCDNQFIRPPNVCVNYAHILDRRLMAARSRISWLLAEAD